MRGWIGCLIVLVPALAHAGGAGFDRFPKADGKALLDVAHDRDRMIVLADESEKHFVVLFAPDPKDGFDNRVFYGDGKTFHAVPVRSWSWNDDGTDIEYRFEDPRFDVYPTEIKYEKDHFVVSCGKSVTTLDHPKGPLIKKVLKEAEFQRSPFDWQPYTLARNEAGVYFYVDRGRWDDNKKQFRVFRGMKGKLRQQKLTNVVSDSEGDIFSTTSGDLRLILNRTEYWWVANDDKQQLTVVPPEKNIGLIYNDLGVYTGERLGTPCDDL